MFQEFMIMFKAAPGCPLKGTHGESKESANIGSRDWAAAGALQICASQRELSSRSPRLGPCDVVRQAAQAGEFGAGGL